MGSKGCSTEREEFSSSWLQSSSSCGVSNLFTGEEEDSAKENKFAGSDRVSSRVRRLVFLKGLICLENVDPGFDEASVTAG